MLFRLKFVKEFCRVMQCRLFVTTESTLKYRRKFVPRELSILGLVLFIANNPVEVHRFLEDQELIKLNVHFVQGLLLLIFSLHL